jgi:hypothetical protein
LEKEPAVARSTTPAGDEIAVPPNPSPAPTDDVHDWLTQRISSLQEERQTRWNKLLGMILGS